MVFPLEQSPTILQRFRLHMQITSDGFSSGVHLAIVSIIHSNLEFSAGAEVEVREIFW